MYKVFSCEGEDYRDSRNNYQKHDVQIMKMKSNGDISFVVYGYMNRGKHEGNNGIAVYQFSASAVSYTHLDVYKRQADTSVDSNRNFSTSWCNRI